MAPSIAWPSRRCGCAWLGVALSLLALSSWPERIGSVAAGAVWAALWILYLSFVNIGQTFYSFGWETLLCEVGFFTIFAGASRAAPSLWLVMIWRWTLFRLLSVTQAWNTQRNGHP